MTDDDIILYLAGAIDQEVEPTIAVQLDDLRVALTDPATWVQPHPDLEERVITEVTAAAAGELLDATALRGAGLPPV